MFTVFAPRASTILYNLAASTPMANGVYLLPANVCPIVPLAFLSARRPFEFIDLAPESLCMSEALVRQRLASPDLPQVVGILFVRTYGVDCDVTTTFRAFKALQPDLLIIDDRCLSRPLVDADELEWQGADAIVFSTGSAKPVELGFGGFAHLQPQVSYKTHRRVFQPEDLAYFIALYHAHIRDRLPLYTMAEAEPYCSRLQQLRWLDTTDPAMPWSVYRHLLLEKRSIAEQYAEAINGIYRHWIPASAQLAPTYHTWRFQCRVTHREVLLKKIFAAGFFASAHYFPAATLFGDIPCPVATALSTEILNLFNDFHVSQSDAEQIGRIVRSHLADHEGVR